MANGSTVFSGEESVKSKAVEGLPPAAQVSGLLSGSNLASPAASTAGIFSSSTSSTPAGSGGNSLKNESKSAAEDNPFSYKKLNELKVGVIFKAKTCHTWQEATQPLEVQILFLLVRQAI